MCCCGDFKTVVRLDISLTRPGWRWSFVAHSKLMMMLLPIVKCSSIDSSVSRSLDRKCLPVQQDSCC